MDPKVLEAASLMYDAWNAKEIPFESLLSLSKEMQDIFDVWSSLSVEDLEAVLSLRTFHTIGLLEDMSRSVVDLANIRSPLLAAEKSDGIARTVNTGTLFLKTFVVALAAQEALVEDASWWCKQWNAIFAKIQDLDDDVVNFKKLTEGEWAEQWERLIRTYGRKTLSQLSEIATTHGLDLDQWASKDEKVKGLVKAEQEKAQLK